MKKEMKKKQINKELSRYESVVWDLSYALVNQDGGYKHDAYGRVMIYDDPDDDCSIIELPEPDKLEWRDDHHDYTFNPNDEIGIILSKRDIDPENEMTPAQWQECVGEINRGKVDLRSLVEEVQDCCEVIVEEMGVSK